MTSSPVRWPMRRPDLPAGQLGHVGVLLLRQHRAAGGVGVVEACRSRTPRSTTARAPRPGGTGGRRAGPGRRGPRPRSRGRTRRRASSRSGRAKPSSSATPSGSSGSDEPASAPAPERRHVEPVDRGQQPVDVAGQRPPVGQQVVGQQHRLGPLQVGVAREVGVAGLVGPGEQDLLEGDDLARPPRSARAWRTAGGRWRPGRCGCGRCAAWRPTSPASSVTRRSTAVWMSSSSGAKTNVPAASSSSTRSRAASSAVTSSSLEDAGPAESPARGPASRPGRRAPAAGRSGRLTVKADHGSAVPVAETAVPQRHDAARPGPAPVGRPRALAGRPGGHAQAPQPHEALGVLVAEGVGGVVGGQAVVVEATGLRRPTTEQRPARSKRSRTSPVTWRCDSAMKASSAGLSGENHRPS